MDIRSLTGLLSQLLLWENISHISYYENHSRFFICATRYQALEKTKWIFTYIDTHHGFKINCCRHIISWFLIQIFLQIPSSSKVLSVFWWKWSRLLRRAYLATPGAIPLWSTRLQSPQQWWVFWSKLPIFKIHRLCNTIVAIMLLYPEATDLKGMGVCTLV